MAEARKGGGRRRTTPKDEAEFGNNGKAHDGEPGEDNDLERKRREREAAKASESDAAAAAAVGGDALADKDVENDEPQEELFPVGSLEGDPKMTLGKLIKANHRVEYTVSLMAAEVPLRGGLIDPDAEGHVMVTYEVANLTPVPIREDRGGVKKLVGWKIRQSLRPVYVEPIEATKPEAATG